MYYFHTSIKSLVESNNVLKGMSVFRTSEDKYDEIAFNKFCGGGDGDNNREKIFHIGDIIQAVGRFILEENCKNVCIDWIGISINMFFQVLITTK